MSSSLSIALATLAFNASLLLVMRSEKLCDFYPKQNSLVPKAIQLFVRFFNSICEGFFTVNNGSIPAKTLEYKMRNGHTLVRPKMPSVRSVRSA